MTVSLIIKSGGQGVFGEVSQVQMHVGQSYVIQLILPVTFRNIVNQPSPKMSLEKKPISAFTSV